MVLLTGQVRASEPLADDPRLSVTVREEARDQPLGELLAQLALTIGVPLRAGADTADQKVTMLTDPRPAAEVMGLLSAHLEYQWRHKGNGYELIQPSEKGQKEAGQWEQERMVEWACLATALMHPPPLEGTPHRWMVDREAEIRQRLANEGLDETERSSLNEERSALIATLHPGREAAQAVFRSLTIEQVRRLLTGQALWLSTADGTLQSSAARRVRQAELEAAQLPAWQAFFQLVGDRWPPGQAEVLVRLDEIVPRRDAPASHDEPRLRLLFLIPIGPEEHHRVFGLPGWSVETQEPQPESLPPTETDDPDLLHPVTLRLATASDPVTLADIATAVRQTTGLEMLCDSFTRARLWRAEVAEVEKRPRPLAQLFDNLCAALGYEWEKKGHVILLRSRLRYRDRAQEAPERVLRPWRDRVRREQAATMEDMAALAAVLTDRQARGVQQYWSWYFADISAEPPAGESGIYGCRHLLRLWDGLTAAQRGTLLHGTILPVVAMSNRQREQFSTALLAQNGSPIGELLHPPTANEVVLGGLGFQPAFPEGDADTISFYLSLDLQPARQLELRITRSQADSQDERNR
jgi:hypothetical protein